MADEVFVVELELDKRKFQSDMRGILSLTRGIGGQLVGVFKSVAAAAGLSLAGVGAGLAAITMNAVKASADMDSLRRSLVAVTGSAEAAEQQLKNLKRLADISPVLDLQSAIKGAVQLQSSGFGPNDSQRIMSVISNAVARGGGNIDGFQRVLTNLQQIASQGKLTGDELRETAAFIPGFRKALADAFPQGTEGLSGLEVIQGVIKELAKLPVVGGGVQTAFDNIGSSIKLALSKIGDVINAAVIPALDKVRGVIDYLSESGILTRLTQKMVGAFDPKKITDGLIKGVSYLIALLEKAPSVAENMSKRMASAFRTVNESLGLMAAVLGAIFLTGTIQKIVAGIVIITKAMIELTMAVKAFGITQVVANAALSQGKTLAKDLAMMAAAAAAGYGIFKGIELLVGNVGKGISEFVNGLGAGEIGDRANEINAGITRATTGLDGATGGKSGFLDFGPSDTPKGIDPAAVYLPRIESNTKRMVDSLKDVLMGGGTSTQAVFNPRNQNTWAGGGGGSWEAQLIQAVKTGFGEQGIAMARAGMIGRSR